MNIRSVRKPVSWAMLLLPSPSPGAVFQLIQRRLATTGTDRATLEEMGLRLSHPAGRPARRALIGREPLALQEWGLRAGPVLSEAFTPPVSLVWSDETNRTWGYVSWVKGVEVWRLIELLPRPSSGLIQLVSRRSPEAARVQAMGSLFRGTDIPLRALAALVSDCAAPDRIPTIDYATVARLDQKNLLVEDGPRWYRFAFQPI